MSHFALRRYLTERNIDNATAMNYLKEINFSVDGKTHYDIGCSYFGLGFKNDCGGYEIRNKYFKGCSSKDITTIDKSLPNCNVFEGFFDFLSYESLNRRFPQQYPSANALVLNSTINLEKSKVEDFLKKHKEVNCYFDDDEAGKQAFFRLNEKIGTYCETKDCSSLYRGYKDFNEFAIHNHKISQSYRQRL